MNNPFYFQPDQWLVTMTSSLLSQSSCKPLRSIFKTLGLFLALQDLLIVLLVLYLISFILLPQPLVKLKAPTSELPTPESPLPEHPICEMWNQGCSNRRAWFWGFQSNWWTGDCMVGGRDGEGVAISPGTLFILRIAPTELVVREHIVQQTLVRKEEK